MKLDQLKVLRAVVDTGSVKAAAESLNRTQPAVSQALKALEFQTGTELFDRTGYRLELTPVGRRVYLQSLRVLSEAEDLTQLIQHFEKGQEETITIAIDAATDLDVVTPVLAKVQARFPDTRLVLRGEVLSGAIGAVQSGEAALALAPAIHVMLEEGGFDYRPVARSAMRNVAAPSLLDAMDAPGTLADLRRFHQVIARDSGQASGLFDRELGVQKGQRRWYVNDLHMKKQLLVAGLGWGRLPEHMIAEELAQDALREIVLPHTHLSFGIEVFVFRQRKPAIGPVAAYLWNAFEECSL
ncbi:LysR family transcriptional regulator [Aliishimia ponticola]|uniref:LysR family transcriptional regulator n=1 Tax=Aliishimia ponticola TaxID=2499833 RepID=A0A4S4N8B9_9RHOB|nr:LysR family transcriptional regulator [Aliishimia ponticola]THH35369.1 LysR family transcriptional regulator [Aliishimia ponticola]